MCHTTTSKTSRKMNKQKTNLAYLLTSPRCHVLVKCVCVCVCVCKLLAEISKQINTKLTLHSRRVCETNAYRLDLPYYCVCVCVSLLFIVPNWNDFVRKANNGGSCHNSIRSALSVISRSGRCSVSKYYTIQTHQVPLPFFPFRLGNIPPPSC